LTVELRHVRVFLALAEELHFGRTARRLRVAQSAVSQTIQALEREIGAELFVRSSGVTLSPAGAAFVVSARRAIEELSRGASAARAAATGEGGRLSVSFGPLVALGRLAGTMARFQRAFPRIDVELQAWSTTEQLAALGEGRTDVAFVQAAKHDLGAFAHQVIDRMPIVAVLPSEHGFGRRRSVAFRELSGEDLLVLEDAKDARIRAQILEQCRIHAFEPKRVIGVPQLEALLAWIAAGIGISFAPAVVSCARFPGVVTVPVRPAIMTEIVAAWNGPRLPAAGRRLVDLAIHDASAPREREPRPSDRGERKPRARVAR
jgi:DNA-binding transcriptional LysR family regulator